MAAQLKHKIEDEKVVSLNKQAPKFQEYQAFDSQKTKFQDLIFFGRIVAFSICSVLSCFVLLSVNLTPILSFPLGMVMGVFLTATIFFLIDLLKR